MENQSLIPIRCKAAVCRANGAPLVIEEIFVDPPKAFEIRIKIICTSLCHTDLGFWSVKEDGAVPALFPRILGHEAFGVVESIGEHVEEFAVGDSVVPTFLGECDTCSSCASERNNMCSSLPFSIAPGMRRDGTTRFRDAHGAPVHDFLAVSSFSQYTVVDVNQVVKVNPDVPPKVACLLGCGAGTGLGAAWRLAKVEPGSSVVIFGLGTVGLAVAQGAKMCGASKIIGVDLNPDKQEFGKMFGVTDFINPSEIGERSVIEVIMEMTARLWSSGGKVLGEEEKAAENVYIKKMEQEKLAKVARKGPSTGEPAPPTPSSAANDVKAGVGGPTASTSAGASNNKNRNYAILASAAVGLGAMGWYLLAKEPEKTEEVVG